MTVTPTYFNQVSTVKTFGVCVSITSIEKPSDDFTHVTSDIKFERGKVSHKLDK